MAVRSYDPDTDFGYVYTVYLTFQIWPWVKVRHTLGSGTTIVWNVIQIQLGNEELWPGVSFCSLYPHNEVRGYTGIIMSICLSIHPSVIPSCLELARTFYCDSHSTHNCCPWPKGVSWSWYYTHSHNPCSGHNSLQRVWIFHTIVVHDRKVCHDLEPRLYL